jgi:hypothetical protein
MYMQVYIVVFVFFFFTSVVVEISLALLIKQIVLLNIIFQYKIQNSNIINTYC